MSFSTPLHRAKRANVMFLLDHLACLSALLRSSLRVHVDAAVYYVLLLLTDDTIEDPREDLGVAEFPESLAVCLNAYVADMPHEPLDQQAALGPTAQRVCTVARCLCEFLLEPHLPAFAKSCGLLVPLFEVVAAFAATGVNVSGYDGAVFDIVQLLLRLMRLPRASRPRDQLQPVVKPLVALLPRHLGDGEGAWGAAHTLTQRRFVWYSTWLVAEVLAGVSQPLNQAIA